MKSVVELAELFPRAQDGILESIDAVGVPLAHLNTPIRLAYFLAQCAHESGGFQFTKEFDGLRYCGRGIIQVTGKANYIDCGEWIGLPIVEQPELLEEAGPAVRSACWYWMTRNLNATADLQNFVQCTKKINGGVNGLKSRLQWLRKIQRALR